ncbi:MAG: hypothetical protein HC848_01660 [Limnobacter sp.]|nr:hypothetical protein [Limnobacter sp.]
MNLKPLPLFSDALAYWKIGLVAALVVAALLAWGLSMRTRFVAESTAQIGGVMNENNIGVLRFQPFEDAKEIEKFVAEEVLPKAPGGAGNKCNAWVKYASSGFELKTVCRGNDKEQVRTLALLPAQAVVNKHAHFYTLTKTLEAQHQKSLEREIQGAKEMIQALKKEPVFGESEPKIIDYQLKVEALTDRLEIDRLKGERVTATRLNTEKAVVEERTPGLRVWCLVLVLALCSAVFAALFAATLQRARHA